MSSPAADLEERTRVVVALPVCFRPQALRRDDPTRAARLNLLKAFNRTIAYVRTLREHAVALTGYTVSQNEAFVGYWVMTEGPTAGTWAKDDIRLLVLDFRTPVADPLMRSVLREVRLRTVQNYFFGPDEQQEEVWVVAHPLLRQTVTEEERKWVAEKVQPPAAVEPSPPPAHS